MDKIDLCTNSRSLEDEVTMYLVEKLIEEMDEIDATYSDYLDNLSEKDMYQNK